MAIASMNLRFCLAVFLTICMPQVASGLQELEPPVEAVGGNGSVAQYRQLQSLALDAELEAIQR